MQSAVSEVVAPDRSPIANVVVPVGLVVVAAALRAGPLAPSSLWLDDAWVALVSRGGGVGDALTVGFTAPGMGFLQWAWFELVGFSELRAQALPFAFGVLGPAAAYLVAARRGPPRPAALLGAAVLLVAPLHIEYSTRVKQYTFDVLLALALTALAWRLIEAPGRRERWVQFVVGSVVATMCSAAVVPYVVAGSVAGLYAAWRRGEGLRVGAVSLAGYAVFGVLWWQLVLARAVSDELRSDWAPYFLRVREGPSAVVSQLAVAFERVLTGLSPLPPALSALVLGAALLAVAWRRPALALLLATPLVLAVVLAARDLAPLGGGRTDIYLYPSLALTVAAGAALLPAVRTAAAWVPALVAAVALSLATTAPGPYPTEDVRPLVARLGTTQRRGDQVLVYSATRWAYALYSTVTLRLWPDPARVPGVRLGLVSPDVRILGPHRDTPERYAADLAAATAGRQRVWFVASHWKDDLPAIDAAFVSAGFQQVERAERPGAVLELWERATAAERA